MKTPFHEHVSRYEAWFERHAAAYTSELDALRAVMEAFQPCAGRGLEIGVGTGRFAAPLGCREGVEPAVPMARVARSRGIAVVGGIGEALPFSSGVYDWGLMVTTICFLSDPLQGLREAWRVLRPGGAAVIGFVDRESALGKRYEKHKEESPFYRVARFFSAGDVAELMVQAGFVDITSQQTLFGDGLNLDAPQPPRAGVGEGGFVAMAGIRPPAWS